MTKICQGLSLNVEIKMTILKLTIMHLPNWHESKILFILCIKKQREQLQITGKQLKDHNL